jgi:hypothetical protein
MRYAKAKAGAATFLLAVIGFDWIYEAVGSACSPESGILSKPSAPVLLPYYITKIEKMK